jgi:hypothetical protein
MAPPTKGMKMKDYVKVTLFMLVCAAGDSIADHIATFLFG